MKKPSFSISPSRFDAVIFDLDGVVTQTARVHSEAWKRLFDEFLRERAARDGGPFRPFDLVDDYLPYVDGKPRYDGVASFLASRGIELEWGAPDDDGAAPTVCGLGNRKNALLRDAIEAHGVDAYASTLDLIRALRARGVRTAIISSSENCMAMLASVGATGLFDAAVDGVESARIGIRGKPAPDIFLEAARRLGVEPARAVVVEDAISGVQAARAGGFGCVIGVNRSGDPARLAQGGADVVVADLAEVGVALPDARELPSALDRLDDIVARPDRRPVVFLDYDGTLTPIVARPQDAELAPAVRETVVRLAQVCPVAIISGRDLADVRALVGVDGIVYAGSHGFEIAAPDGTVAGGNERDRYLPTLSQAEGELEALLAEVPGAQIERKKYSIAVHYRNVAAADLPAIEDAVRAVLQRYPTLRDLPGKKVHDLQPRIDWDKGKAVLHVLRALGLDRPAVLPVYIGDDITDEDAFAALRTRGVGIVVREEPRPTAATLALDHPRDVHRLLAALLERLKGGSVA